MKIAYLVHAMASTVVSFTGIITNIVQGNVAWQSTPLHHRHRLHLVIIGCIILAIASACTSSTPQNTSISTHNTSTGQPPTTNWGLLTGDSLGVNKLLTCGVGCPEPLHLRIQTMQIDTTNDLMTWNIHFLAPINGATNGITDAAFPNFALQSNTTPFTQGTLTINSPGNLQAKFPFTPVPNEIYTLTVTASYHTLTNGIKSIDSTTLQYELVTMSFQP